MPFLGENIFKTFTFEQNYILYPHFRFAVQVDLVKSLKTGFTYFSKCDTKVSNNFRGTFHSLYKPQLPLYTSHCILIVLRARKVVNFPGSLSHEPGKQYLQHKPHLYSFMLIMVIINTSSDI